MSVVPLIVGCIFFAFGINSLVSFSRFKKQGTKVKGHVKAIKKYTSISGTGSDRRTTVYYSPIIEYQYKEQMRIVNGISASEIRHKLKQNVSVLVIEQPEKTEPEAEIDDSLNYLIGSIFTIAGLIALVVYFNIGGSWIIATLGISIATVAGYFISTLMTSPDQNYEDVQKEHADSILIETKADYIKEVSKHSFWGYVFAYALMLCGLAAIYAGYSELPSDAVQMIVDDFSTFWEKLTSGTIPNSWEKPLMICGIGIFCFLTSLRSIYYVTKKYGNFLKM